MTNLDKLLNIINEETALNLTSADIHTDFQEFEIDSLDITTIALLVESEFNVEIPDTEPNIITTVNDLLMLIESSQ